MNAIRRLRAEHRRTFLKPLVWLLVIILLFGMLQVFATQRLQDMRQVYQTKQAQYASLRQQVGFLQKQAQLSKQYAPVYAQITPKDLVKQRGRIAWTDALLKIQSDLLLAPFSFQFEPEGRLLAQDVAHLPLGQPIFYYTRLHLTAGLQTDRDVITLFQRITREITKYFLYQECTLIRNDWKGEPRLNLQQGNVLLKCSLVFFEARPRDFKGVSS